MAVQNWGIDSRIGDSNEILTSVRMCRVEMGAGPGIAATKAAAHLISGLNLIRAWIVTSNLRTLPDAESIVYVDATNVYWESVGKDYTGVTGVAIFEYY